MAGPGRSGLRSISGCSGGRQPANGLTGPKVVSSVCHRLAYQRAIAWMVESLSGRISSSMPSSACGLQLLRGAGDLCRWRCTGGPAAGLLAGLLVLLGAFTVLLAQVFWLVDARSQQLLELTIVALKEMEADYPELPAVRRRCAGAEPGDQLHLRHPRTAAGADGLRPGCGRLRTLAMVMAPRDLWRVTRRWRGSSLQLRGDGSGLRPCPTGCRPRLFRLQSTRWIRPSTLALNGCGRASM